MRGVAVVLALYVMMRLLFLILIWCAQTVSAQSMDVQSKAALESMRGGYVQYAFDEFKRLAASNDMAAQYYLGWCYENGVACDKALTDAFRLYRRAAERGLPDAMLRLASFYKNGIVVSQDDGRYNEGRSAIRRKAANVCCPISPRHIMGRNGT